MKKAQATMFVIFGLIIITLLFTAYYFRAEIISSFEKKTLEEQPIISQISLVKTYTEDCITESLNEGINILGIHGGYINLPEDEFPNAPAGLLTNSLDIFGDGGIKIPYWSYKTLNGLQKTQVPTKQQMESELESFVNTETISCLNDYQEFKLQAYDIFYRPPITKIAIGDDAVIADVNMQLDVTHKETTQNFKNFKVKVNSPLGRLYSRAIELFEYESKTTFLENFTLETMAIYDEIPYSGVDFECSPESWLKSNVILDLKSILALNIPTLKIKGTDYKLRNAKDKLLVRDAFKAAEKDMTVTFMYTREWPLIVEVIGEDSELLMGKPFTTENEAAQFLLPLFCLNDYHFVYDLKFPVLATLTEDSYTFQFPIMGVIDNNQPKENKANIQFFEDGIDICERKDTRMRVIAVEKTSDGSSVPLENVDLKYNCASQECRIGTTRLEESGFALTSQFPQCIGGKLIASKDGYHTSSKEIDTNLQGTVAIELEPYHELQAEVLINDEGTIREPYQTEVVLFQIENRDMDYFTTFFYPYNDKIKLLPGNYKITATLLVQSNQGFKLEKTDVEICSDVPQRSIAGLIGLTKKECETQQIDGMKLDTIIGGGGSFLWNINKKELLTSNKVVFYANRGPTPQNIMDVSELYQNQQKFSKGVKKPTFE
ncbi:MAG: hypothetical protein Q8Q42_03580 [Nanoarchaeota archaeon]|nr:hypothetical protein [Nanoarchaeota archaeon]